MTLQHRASSYSMDEVSRMSADAVYKAMKTSENGLSASQAQIRLDTYGPNAIEEERKTPTIIVFLKSFTHLMAILLWAAGLVALIAGLPELGIAVWLVNIINGVFSFWQEYKAGKAAEALKRMLPQYVTVIRDGQADRILAEDMVPGDVFIIEEGDRISVDARLVAASRLQIDQSTLNGESTPVRKHADAADTEGLPAAEMPNLIYAGTSVVGGTGSAVVIHTGMNTRFGKIARLTQNTQDNGSPLQRELNHVTRRITVFAAIIGAAFFVLDVLFVKNAASQAFIFALGMMVAFIPEGLLPTVTLSLAMAVQRMSKRNALVKRLSSVESLGCTSVICTDKTGTLTRNEMTVERLWTLGHEYVVTGTGYAPEGNITVDGLQHSASDDADLRSLVLGGTLCSNAHVIRCDDTTADNTSAGDTAIDDAGNTGIAADNTGSNAVAVDIAADGSTSCVHWRVTGDPTEACLLVACRKAGINPDEATKQLPRVAELPFDSRRKMMSVVVRDDGSMEDNDAGKLIAVTKGAPGEVARLCTHARINGRNVPLTNDMLNAINQTNDMYADQGLRVLAVACRHVSLTEETLQDCAPEDVERDLTFLGLEIMVDPPRAEVADAVRTCREAGVRIIMITGDYGRTAKAIARRIGIVTSDDARVISGAELATMNDADLTEALRGEVIFARMAPEQKLRVVACLQTMGEIVATTGDGVNDAPALKKADVGVAMGITGTDVAKEAADIVLTDDNFASIVSAIEEGRAVYANIRRFLLYILNSNMPEAVPSAVYLFSGGAVPLPLTTMQILTIDLGTDMIPALGLGTEPPEKDVMKEPPRNPNERLLTGRIMVKAFLWYGFVAAVLSMLGYFFVNMLNGWPAVPLAGLSDDNDAVYRLATTMTLASIVFAQIGAVWNCRTETESAFSVGLFSNKTINLGIITEILLLIAIATVPALQAVFHTAMLKPADYAYLAMLPFVTLGIEELRKYIWRRMRRRREMR